jgi:hypothetical protein
LIDDALVVADLTGSNPNVFYELGIRHATRKPIVTIIEGGERIPFDVNQSRTIQFTYKDLDSVDVCKTQLEDQVRALEANPTDFFTPVSVAVDLKSMYESGDPEERRDAHVLAALQEVQAELSQLGGEVARLWRRVDTPRASTRLALPTSTGDADVTESIGATEDATLLWKDVRDVLAAESVNLREIRRATEELRRSQDQQKPKEEET